jgi:2-polyprenyl-6-methoxyphenol hydroxylase-like FAD-dependent oxidoreductase
LTGIGTRPGGITATIEQDGDERDVETSWIVGCDGLHSTTRRLVGIDYPGTGLEAPWAVIDAVIGLSTRPRDPRIGRIDKSVADQLGIDGVTILAVRPDRFVGFRHHGMDTRAVEDYLAAFTS